MFQTLFSAFWISTRCRVVTTRARAELDWNSPRLEKKGIDSTFSEKWKVASGFGGELHQTGFPGSSGAFLLPGKQHSNYIETFPWLQGSLNLWVLFLLTGPKTTSLNLVDRFFLCFVTDTCWTFVKITTYYQTFAQPNPAPFWSLPLMAWIQFTSQLLKIYTFFFLSFSFGLGWFWRY